MFTLEITTDVAALFANSPAWNALSRGVPFRETSWLGPWWTHFGEDCDAYVVVARDQSGAVRGLLPLYRAGGHGPGRVLACMGDGQACSDHVSVLAHPHDAEVIAYQMGQHLASIADCSQFGWDAMDIDGVVEGDFAMAALARGLEAGGSKIHASSRMSVWYKPADATWEDHLKHYGKTQRRKMRRWSEKIGDDGPFRQQTASTTTQVFESLDRLIEMHQQRWNEAGYTGSFAHPKFRGFIHDAAQSFLRRGQLYLSSLEYVGQAIAAELGFIGGDHILYVFSAGFDTEHSDLEPGRVLSVDTLQHLYRASLRGIDYMRGDEEYKKRYATESRKLIRLRVVAPALLPRMRHAAWNTGFEFKQWMRRQTGRPVVTVVDWTGTPTGSPVNPTF